MTTQTTPERLKLTERVEKIIHVFHCTDELLQHCKGGGVIELLRKGGWAHNDIASKMEALAAIIEKEKYNV